MDYTFGKTLLHFSYSCELIDDATFSRFRELVLNYTKKVLEIDVDRLFIEGEHASQKILYPLGLARNSTVQSIPVHDLKGRCSSLAGLSYEKTAPLWVVSLDRKHPDLRMSRRYQDLWSGESHLPPYWKTNDQELRDVPLQTTILIPLRRDGMNYGVHSFETSKRLEATSMAKDELQTIATAMCNVYIANLQFRKRMEQTREACKQLQTFLQKPLPVLTQPKIFLASSDRADSRVIDMIKKTIQEEYKDAFELVFWKDEHQPGNINTHLLRMLSKCRFGICYFSEEIQGTNGRRTFQDNPNVIFEAGMLHSRSVNNVDFPADWVPIREPGGTPAPFDLRPERTILVPRNTRGNLNVRKFRGILKKRLDELIMPASEARHQRTRVA
ncbi:MAG: hypothetical protein NPIRA02_28340 [Nitrospirales bacterium]|nr:MAG: hypothetical protein NPIRA02_28340 [Nitrospirales bacterium]